MLKMLVIIDGETGSRELQIINTNIKDKFEILKAYLQSKGVRISQIENFSFFDEDREYYMAYSITDVDILNL